MSLASSHSGKTGDFLLNFLILMLIESFLATRPWRNSHVGNTGSALAYGQKGVFNYSSNIHFFLSGYYVLCSKF